MPRGVPKAGFRKTKNWKKTRKASPPVHLRINDMGLEMFLEGASTETDAQIEARLTERFEILTSLADAAITGDARALIVSGPAGLGKSYTIEQALQAWDPEVTNHTIIKGYVRPTGLYRTLHAFKERGQVIVFDDADSIFFDDVSLNMLKAVCDTTERRVVSYLSEANLKDEEDERLPNSFAFEGTIIFITNLDFDALIARGHKLAPHLGALISRAHYVDLSMKTKRDHIVRIKQVIRGGMLREHGLNASLERDVVAFLDSNIDRLRELSLRMAIKVGNIRRMDKPNWASVALVTCCRN